MLILALDTSGDTCSVAISDGTVCRVEYTFRHERHLTERLPGIIEFLLQDARVALTDIEAFAVGRGSGSFTGVRVGVTMAKVWAMTLEKPVVGVSSLDALVEQYQRFQRPCIAVAPTRRKESVVAFYLPRMVVPVRPPVVMANAAILDAAHEAFREVSRDYHPFGNYLLIGEAAEAIFREEYDTTEPGGYPRVQEWIDPYNASVSAAAIARLGYADLMQGNYSDPDTLVPLYVTPPPTG